MGLVGLFMVLRFIMPLPWAMTLRLALSGLLMPVSQQRCTTAPAWARYTIGLAALGLAGFCVHQAIVPPVRQVDITIRGLKTTANSHAVVAHGRAKPDRCRVWRNPGGRAPCSGLSPENLRRAEPHGKARYRLDMGCYLNRPWPAVLRLRAARRSSGFASHHPPP